MTRQKKYSNIIINTTISQSFNSRKLSMMKILGAFVHRLICLLNKKMIPPKVNMVQTISFNCSSKTCCVIINPVVSFLKNVELANWTKNQFKTGTKTTGKFIRLYVETERKKIYPITTRKKKPIIILFFRGGALQLRFQNKKPQDIFVEKGWLKMTKDDDGNGMYLYMYFVWICICICVCICKFGTVFVNDFSFPPPTHLHSFASVPPPSLLLRLRSFAPVTSPLLLLLLLLAHRDRCGSRKKKQKQPRAGLDSEEARALWACADAVKNQRRYQKWYQYPKANTQRRYQKA